MFLIWAWIENWFFDTRLWTGVFLNGVSVYNHASDMESRVVSSAFDDFFEPEGSRCSFWLDWRWVIILLFISLTLSAMFEKAVPLNVTSVHRDRNRLPNIWTASKHGIKIYNLLKDKARNMIRRLEWLWVIFLKRFVWNFERCKIAFIDVLFAIEYIFACMQDKSRLCELHFDDD